MTILCSILSTPRIFNAIFLKDISYSYILILMKKLKYKIEHITRKEIKDIRYIKQSIFNGTIFIFKKISSCEKIVHLTNGYFYKYFGCNIENFIKNENLKIFEKRKLKIFKKKLKIQIN